MTNRDQRRLLRLPPLGDRRDPRRPQGLGRARDVPALVSSGAHVLGFGEQAYWLDVGTPAAYTAGSRDLVLGVLRSAAMPGEPGDCLVLDGALIAADSVVCGGSVVGEGAVVGAGARVEGSIVMTGALVGAGAVVRDSVLGNGGGSALVSSWTVPWWRPGAGQRGQRLRRWRPRLARRGAPALRDPLQPRRAAGLRSRPGLSAVGG